MLKNKTLKIIILLLLASESFKYIFINYSEKESIEISSKSLVGETYNKKITNYLLTIKIDKINLTKEIFNKEYQDIDNNIILLKESIMPDESNYSNIILVGHSGYGEKAYFEKIKLLTIGDIIDITYNNQNYKYKLIKKEDKTKDKFISLTSYKDNILTLITCKNDEKFLVITGQLIK